MSSIVIQGDTSGSITVEAPSVAGTHTLTLPSATETLATQTSLGVRNLIINGNMQIAQRGTSVSGLTSGNNGYYTVDRWFWQEVGTPTFQVTMSQDTDVPTGQGFGNSVKYDITTAQGSLGTSDALLLSQKLEGQMLQHIKKGTSSAESLTISFWVKTNKTGTYIVELYDSDNSRHVSQSYTVTSADTWEKKTITFAGDTSGTITNNNGISLSVSFWFASGTDFTSGTLQTSWGAYSGTDRAAGLTVNLADNTANYINITGVQLEVGTEATPFEHRPYDMELQRCQRYYYKIESSNGQDNGGVGLCRSTTSALIANTFPVSMRVRPTALETTGTASNYAVRNSTAGSVTCTAVPAFFSASTDSAVSDYVVASGIVAGNSTIARSNVTSSYLAWSAEL